MTEFNQSDKPFSEAIDRPKVISNDINDTVPRRDYEAELKKAVEDIRLLEGEVKRNGIAIQQLNYEVEWLTNIIKRVTGIYIV